MKFTRLEIPDLILIEPKVFGDPRGFFFESFQQQKFAENGIRENFVQDNHSQSSRGVLRGLHYQIPPKAQGKFVRVIRGEVFDVALDVRKNSKTFGKHVVTILSDENKKMLYVPPGFAHGFCVLSEEAEFLYKVTEFYSPEHERGVLWNDPALKIDWPKLDYLLSEKDKALPPLQSAVLF